MKHQTLQDSRWVGRVLREKWRIDRKIARGGMGTVFAATHKNNGSTAAIKILHPEFSREKDTRARFLQEGYAANKVNHPGVVRIIDDDVTDEGQAFLVMELLEGELLEQRRIRKGGKLPLSEVYELADQLLDVLAAAHAQDIVHRDIKPDNIFLTSQGRLKVLDFGFAQMKTSFRPEQTATGFLLGTPGFMAPEQAIGNRPLIDARTDIWAAGATLFMLLTGQPVHEGETAAEQLVAAANFAVRSITTLEPNLPTKLARAVDRALEFDRDARWPDARAMQEALRAVPGRPGVKKIIRRSIVDAEEARPTYPAPVPAPDETLSDMVDQVHDDDLARTDETAHVVFDHATDLDAPTGNFRAAQQVPHEADSDLETPNFRPPVSQRQPERAFDAAPAPAPAVALRVGGLAKVDDGLAHDETVVMDSRPFTAVPHGQGPASVGRPSYPSYADFPAPPRASYVAANELAPMASPAVQPITAPEPAAPGRSSRIFVFVALAAITMAAVVLAGLFLLHPE